jgi:Na+/proline symporter
MKLALLIFGADCGAGNPNPPNSCSNSSSIFVVVLFAVVVFAALIVWLAAHRRGAEAGWLGGMIVRVANFVAAFLGRPRGK